MELVYFGLFDNCNARCNMCECWLAPRADLPLAHYRNVLSAVLSLRPRAVRFTGGEPLIFAELPELVSQAAAEGVRVSVISNGRILGPGKIRALIDSGCTEMVLSIDALRENHDRIRGTPGLFDRCMEAVADLHEAKMDYGVNTVVQALGADDLASLGETLRTQPNPPSWWHLIPVRGDDALRPSAVQRARMRELIPRLRERMSQAGTRMVAADDPFLDAGPEPCTVPTFTSYVRADTGDIFGCNMLVYADPPLGNVLRWRAQDAWNSLDAHSLRDRCATGTNRSCSRCDPSSKAMNHVLRELAASVAPEESP
ncbi:radical SAM protein [Streptomyces griseofuscus]|uniref:radical SAM protein n=1 Tax=Streptomyces griseofuscus TaxID=146922 RepID=UPI0034367974